MNDKPVNADLEAAFETYLGRRRTLGWRLIEEERHGRRFLDWLWAQGNTRAAFTSSEAIIWARGRGNFKASYQCQRLSSVRGFARYCYAIGMNVQVPAVNVLPAGRNRRRPHIYTQDEIESLIGACQHVFSSALVRTTMTNIIGLLAVTGMRIGEALRLNPSDINARQATLLIRANRHGPDRVIPLHHSTVEALAQYQLNPSRQAVSPQPDGPLFVTTKGTGYKRASIEDHFKRLRTTARLRWDGATPVLKDLRHTFATRQMIRAYTVDDGDPAATLSLLALWLGHSDPSHTYWYIQAVPELLALAANRQDATITME